MNHPDLKMLFEKTLRHSTEVLQKSDFMPTAAVMDSTGEFTWTPTAANSKESFQLFANVLRRQRDEGNLRASCVAMDVVFNPPGESASKNAILFLLEHQDGEAVMVHQVYEKKRFRELKLGAQFEAPMPEKMRNWTQQIGAPPRDDSTSSPQTEMATIAAALTEKLDRAGVNTPSAKTAPDGSSSKVVSGRKTREDTNNPSGARPSLLRALLIPGLLFGIPAVACVLLFVRNRTLETKLEQATALVTEQSVVRDDFSQRGTNDLFIIAAVHGSGRRFNDVTEQVRKLLQDSDLPFSSRPKALKSDPTPGWNKELVIVYEFQGKRRLFLAGEGGQVSREKLKNAARQGDSRSDNQN